MEEREIKQFEILIKEGDKLVKTLFKGDGKDYSAGEYINIDGDSINVELTPKGSSETIRLENFRQKDSYYNVSGLSAGSIIEIDSNYNVVRAESLESFDLHAMPFKKDDIIKIAAYGGNNGRLYTLCNTAGVVQYVYDGERDVIDTPVTIICNYDGIIIIQTSNTVTPDSIYVEIDTNAPDAILTTSSFQIFTQVEWDILTVEQKTAIYCAEVINGNVVNKYRYNTLLYSFNIV